jgi:hypothetical protein
MFWELVGHLATLSLVHSGPAALFASLAAFPFVVGLMSPWAPQAGPIRNDSSVYDFSFQNPTGLNANGQWNASQLAHIDGAQNQWGVSPNFQYQRPDASQQGSPGDIQNYLSNEQMARMVFGMTPGSQGSSGGLPINSPGGYPAGATGGAGGAGAWGGLTTQQWISAAGGLAGAYGSYADSQARNEAARANSGPQNYSSQSSNNPYGPSSSYRDIAMQQALALLQGGQGQGGGGGGRGGRGGGGGGGNGGGGSSYGNSQALADAMSQRAMSGDPNVNANAQYMQNALADQYGGSQLLGRTFEAADGMNNSAVDQFVQQMMGQWGGGDARPQGYGGGGTTGSGGGLVSNGHGGMVQGGGGGGGGHQLVGVRGDIRAMLDGSSEANPQLQAMIDQVNRGTTESYQRGLAGLSGQSEASGMYGSSDHQLADSQAALGFTRGLAENETGIRYQDFGRQRDELMQAMGLGTQYDLGMAGIDAQAEASRNSTSASSAAAANSNALQRELGNRGLMLQAMGLQNDMSQFGVGTMQNLSGMDVQNRQFMLGAGLDYGNFDMGQMGTAFGANMGVDQANAQQQAQQAALRNQQQNQAYQRQQAARNQPWNDLARYMDVINGASSGYGTSQESGVRPGTQQPESNNWLAAIQGGLGAAQSANNLYRGWNQGNGA